MSRQKAYYTIDEITNNLYTTGSEWMLQNFTEYKGLYHTYITGEVYTQAKWNPKTSKKLIKYKQPNNNEFVYTLLKPEIKTSYDSIQTYYPKITIEDRKLGSITRYFIKRINSTSIIEISKQQFQNYNSKLIDPNINIAVSLKWTITGKVDDEAVGTVLVEGVKSKNQQAIKQANMKVPGLSSKLTNLLEFYADTDFIAPADINA